MIFCHLTGVATVLAFRTLLSRENKRRGGTQREHHGNAGLDATAFKDLTDRENPNFRYVY